MEPGGIVLESFHGFPHYVTKFYKISRGCAFTFRPGGIVLESFHGFPHYVTKFHKISRGCAFSDTMQRNYYLCIRELLQFSRTRFLHSFKHPHHSLTTSTPNTGPKKSHKQKWRTAASQIISRSSDSVFNSLRAAPWVPKSSPQGAYRYLQHARQYNTHPRCAEDRKLKTRTRKR